MELNVRAEVTYPIVYYEEAMQLGLKGSPAIRIQGQDFDDEGFPGIA